jgi:hypothetical protein
VGQEDTEGEILLVIAAIGKPKEELLLPLLPNTLCYPCEAAR